jgi:hypothetical protein
VERGKFTWREIYIWSWQCLFGPSSSTNWWEIQPLSTETAFDPSVKLRLLSRELWHHDMPLTNDCINRGTCR